MYHTLRVFRPHRTPPEQLERTFVGREPLRQEILDKLQKWQPGKSRQHYLIIGPRGIGKTNLLKLIEYRVEKNPKLKNKWYAISLSEDAYGITKVSDLLVEALRILSDKTNDKNLTSTYNKVQFDDNDERVTDLSLDAFRKFHIENGCGILLMVESVNRVLESQFKVKREIHLLRKILIEEEWLILISTSPTYLNAVTNPEEPLFEFFQVKLLEELSPEEQQEMLRKIALLEKNNDFIENYLNKLKPQLRALYHFTGGNPRLTIMLYDLIANQNIRDVRDELDSLLDKLTPFYQDRMKEIADQEAKLLEKMALMAEGSTPTELAKASRMDHKAVSALLTRLERTGYVRREPRRKKRTVYIIPERFFRIWHQMNHSRSARGRIQYLLEFFTSWYTTPEERDQIWEKLTAQFQEVLEINKEERIDELSEYMEYIEEISVGEEKYKRLFERFHNIHSLKGYAVIRKDLERLDKKYGNDGIYFLIKCIFLRKISRYKEAFIAIKTANKLFPENIFILFQTGFFSGKEGVEKVFSKVIERLRKMKGFGSNIRVEDMLIKIFQEEQDPQIVMITSYLLQSYIDENITKKIIDIIQASKSSYKKQIGITTLGFVKAKRSTPVILHFLKDKASNVRGSAATALGRIGSDYAVQPLIDCLKDRASSVRGSASAALGRIGSKLAVQPLIDCLRDSTHNVRENVAAALGRVGSELAVQPLINCLKDSAHNVRASAAAALGRIGSEQAVPYLIDRLKDESNIVRGSAANALGKITSKEAVSYLTDCLKDKANNVRRSAANALGQIGSEEAIPYLIACLKDEENNVRESAAHALGRLISAKAVPYLIDCLKDESNLVRGSAAKFLGRIGSRLAVQPLINCLWDEANNVRGSTATALGLIGSEDAVQYLINCLKDEANIVRGNAAIALGRIGSKLAVQPLINCLKDKSNDIRRNAANALGQIGFEQAVPHLIDCLKDESNIVRGSAVTALGRIGSNKAVPYLINCLKDEANNVRISSIIALGKIASIKPIPNLDRLIQALIEMKSDKVLYRIVQVTRKLLFSAFRSGDIEMIEASIENAKEGFENGEEIFKPYIIALEYIKSNNDPAIMERQQPEMREAVQLLVDSFNTQ